MSKKQDDFYFQNFIECAGYSCQAAHLLKEILSDFKPPRSIRFTASTIFWVRKRRRTFSPSVLPTESSNRYGTVII